MTALHVAFPIHLSQRLRDAAAARGLTPQVLVAGALACMLDGDLLDAVFDGLDPQLMPIGQGRRTNGLTHMQCAVLFLTGRHAQPDGTCFLSPVKLSRLAGGTPQGFRDTQARLVGLGLLARLPKRTPGGVIPHRLTAAGARIAAELSGEPPKGWEGAL